MRFKRFKIRRLPRQQRQFKIKRSAIKAFLDRPRKDFRAWKEVSPKELEQWCDRLPIEPPIWQKLDQVQKTCFVIGARTGRFFYINDTGTGKTLLAIALATYFQKLGEVKRVLVLVPNKINKTEFPLEIEKHAPWCSYTVLRGSSDDKWKQIEETDSLLVLETYGGLARMVSDLAPPKGRRKKNYLKPKRNLVQLLRSTFQGLVLDESTACQNKASLAWRICWQMSKEAKMVYALSGMPHGRDPTSMWGQFAIVDKGETLGETLGLFRAAFFNSTQNIYGGWEHKFDKTKEQLFNDIIANRSIRYEAEGLPGVRPIIKRVELPADAEEYYAQAKSAIRAARGNRQQIERSFLRMRQISSGFLGFKDDETGDKAEYVFPENPKLEMLLSIIESIRLDRKVIVFYDFTPSARMICDALQQELKIKPLWLWGGTKDIDALRHRFDHDAAARVLVMQNRFSFGPNLQSANYQLFYESPVSAIVRRQAERRVERQHSKFKTVFRYDLVCADTVDELILTYNREGADLFDALVNGRERL